MLRSSGDERADLLKAGILRSTTERMATAAGWTKEEPDDRLLLRAQIALCTALGMILLRTSTTLEPLRSATEADLRDPIDELFTLLISADAPRG